MSSSTLLIYIFNLLSIIISTTTKSHVDVPTSCIGLQDGKYLMKLIDDTKYPIIWVKCSNEYIIIDPSLDSDWSSYFTSWIKYHYGVYGADRNDFVNWQEWFLPSLDPINDNFLVSLQCNKCDELSYIQRHNKYTTFYLSALGFGCFNPTRGWPSCDMDYNTYKCRLCHWNEEQSQIIWKDRDFLTLQEADSMNELTGICAFEIRKSTDYVLQSYHECTTYIPTNYNNFKPSIGSDSTHCQCFKPTITTIRNSKIISVTTEEYNIAYNKNKNKETKEKQIEYTSTNHIVHLNNKHFKKGTYRIVHAGTYIIDEDIIFNFNPSTDENNPLDGWWPKQEDSQYYPGAGSYRDPFFLGFFAGITIETSDVILDLNGFELCMSNKFFYQQPFFSIIELSSQSFLPQQGPGFFGSDPIFATNIIIKNGILGLTSHHGIHGNYNKNIEISDILIHNFQTHGIQLNGYSNILLNNLEIGPSTNIAYLNGNYGQLIKLLPTLKKLANKFQNETISFNGRENVSYTLTDLLNILQPFMIKAFNYAYAKSIDIDIDIDQNILDLFINPSGLSYGAVTYGISLNYPSASIFGWHVNDEQSSNAVLNNIFIHDIHRLGDEIIGLAQKGRVFCNAFNGPLAIKSMFGGNMKKVKQFADALLLEDGDIIYGEYVGDIISDIHIAMYEFGRNDFNNWFGIPFFGENEGLLLWAKGLNNKYLSSANKMFSVYCNTDAMFHPSKGLLGIKISGGKNIELNGIKIENLMDNTPFGLDLCGEKDLYHFSQQKPYQIGFCMNMVHAISIDFSQVIIGEHMLSIKNIFSKTGSAFAISTWFDTQINYKTNSSVKISNIYAGHTSFSYEDRPNKAGEACAIRIYSSQMYKVENIYENENIFDIQCINGDVGCFGDLNGKYTNLGWVNNNKCLEIDKSYINTYSSFESDTSPIFYIIITCFIFVCLIISKRIYHDYPLFIKYNKYSADEYYL